MVEVAPTTIPRGRSQPGSPPARYQPWRPRGSASRLMRLQHGTTVAAKARRSRTAALAKAPHQLHGGRWAHVKAQGRLPDGGSAFHRTHDPLTQVSGQRSWHETPPANHNQPHGISYPDSMQPQHALVIGQMRNSGISAGQAPKRLRFGADHKRGCFPSQRPKLPAISTASSPSTLRLKLRQRSRDRRPDQCGSDACDPAVQRSRPWASQDDPEAGALPFRWALRCAGECKIAPQQGTAGRHR